VAPLLRPSTWPVIRQWRPTEAGLVPEPTVSYISDLQILETKFIVSEGWGQYLGQYLDLTVVNDAIGGRSARSYTDEGRFDTIINTATSGDFVVIEFGHNDGSAGSDVDNGRQDAVGDDYDLTATVYDAE
jgi:lysophospholipase L1-like esterase